MAEIYGDDIDWKETALDLAARIREVERIHSPKEETVAVPTFDEFDSPYQTHVFCAGCGGYGNDQKLYELCPTIKALGER